MSREGNSQEGYRMFPPRLGGDISPPGVNLHKGITSTISFHNLYCTDVSPLFRATTLSSSLFPSRHMAQPRPEGVTRLLLENLWQKKGKGLS